MRLVSPIHIYLPRKRSRDKKISLNLNWYRNAHYRENNEVKKMYLRIMAPTLNSLPRFKVMPVTIHYKLFPAVMCDGANVASIVSKFFLDALVKCTNIPDDNLKFVAGESWSYGGIDKKNPRCEITIEGGR